MNKNFDFYFNIFLLLILFLLIQGFIQFYWYQITYHLNIFEYKDITGYSIFIWGENRIVENIQIILIFYTIINIFFFIKSINKKFKERKYLILFFIYFFGLIFFFMEEISWGQHFFNWNTPLFFKEINHQNETNFHNTSNLLNELPRTLLLIWCSLSYFLVKIAKKKIDLSKLEYFIVPSKHLYKISILIIIFVLPDMFFDKLNLYPGNPADELNWLDPGIRATVPVIAPHEIIDLITFNFIKLSELHELIFTYYLAVHSYYLKKINY